MAQEILILASNPKRDLRLDREIDDLISAVERSQFQPRVRVAVQPQQLPALFADPPYIVHFCGHGAGEQGLVLQDENGKEQLISTEALANLFKDFSNEIHCAVFNACDTNFQAESIVKYVNYVIGMSQPILDKAAYYFAIGFYQGLANGRTIEQAYTLGCVAIQIWTETNSQSTQSRQYRHAEVVGQILQPKLLEHLKPVLWKKSTLSSLGSLENNLDQELPSSSIPTHLPPGFFETVEQEIDRKEYKDQARVAYDTFGQFSAENAADLTKAEYTQRKILVSKVKQFWIEGFLKPSLYGINAIKLDLKARPDAIADLSQGIEALAVKLDGSYDELREMQTYKEMGQGRTLLILGAPGSGKTIALLQLTQRLLERSEQNLRLPMPVVFNLSSWARDRKAIVDWLIDELREKYQVPKLLSEPWINRQQLILLLDGLDEVNEEYRNDCVRALNKFMELFPQSEVAVCSRVRDYEALSERLQISSALCLQPLSPKQVYEFLDSVGGALAGLRALLKQDADLEQFAQTPLILNFMSAAYQGWSVERLMQELSSAPDRTQHLFDTYVDRRLDRGAASDYPKHQVLTWLSWLAGRMVQEKQTVFLIEKMQPTWLRNRSEARAYRIRTFIVSGLSVGLIFWLSFELIFGLSFQLITELSVELIFGLIFGLSVGLISGLIVSLPKKILPLEKLSWSWQRAKYRFIREIFTGFSYGLSVGLISGLSFELIFGLDGRSYGLIFGRDLGLIFGLSFGLIFGLGSGLGTFEIVQRVVPNQGIRTSRRNGNLLGLISGLVSGLSFGLISGLVSGLSFGLISGLVSGLSFGLIFGLKYGGAACIQHFTLRQMLHHKGCIPWNYAKFLDFASDRLLMKKVGGGYVFFHRMLMEHLANKNPD
ncbi:NACHT domain-containing protein [Leptolyngbya sp. ST-U4]